MAFRNCDDLYVHIKRIFLKLLMLHTVVLFYLNLLSRAVVHALPKYVGSYFALIFWYLKSAIPVCWCKLAYSWQSKLQSPSILDKLLILHKSYNDLYLARFQQDSNYWLDETGPCIWPVNKNLCVKIT